jgi:hypothetical protein
MTTVTLTPIELAELDRQDPATKGNGGYQRLLVNLQNKVDRLTRRLTLTSRDLERIARYAFDYGNGGWEGRLRRIFGRSLGSNLGRQSRAA